MTTIELFLRGLRIDVTAVGDPSRQVRCNHHLFQAATLSRQAVQRILALRQCVPLLGLTGLCLVEKPSLITPDEELEGVCVEIRVNSVVRVV